jgi:hypothetical protein
MVLLPELVGADQRRHLSGWQPDVQIAERGSSGYIAETHVLKFDFAPDIRSGARVRQVAQRWLRLEDLT